MTATADGDPLVATNRFLDGVYRVLGGSDHPHVVGFADEPPVGAAQYQIAVARIIRTDLRAALGRRRTSRSSGCSGRNAQRSTGRRSAGKQSSSAHS
jgi:hypothetical protein